MDIRKILVSSSRMRLTPASEENIADKISSTADDLKPGTVLKARVVRLLAGNIADIKLPGQTVSVKSFFPLTPGQEFQVRVHADPGGQTISLSPVDIPSSSSTAAVLTPVRLTEVFAGNLLARVAEHLDMGEQLAGTADAKPKTMTDPVQKVADILVSRLRSLALSTSDPSPVQVRQWIRDGGQQWEARLARFLATEPASGNSDSIRQDAPAVKQTTATVPSAGPANPHSESSVSPASQDIRQTIRDKLFETLTRKPVSGQGAEKPSSFSSSQPNRQTAVVSAEATDLSASETEKQVREVTEAVIRKLHGTYDESPALGRQTVKRWVREEMTLLQADKNTAGFSQQAERPSGKIGQADVSVKEMPLLQRTASSSESFVTRQGSEASISFPPLPKQAEQDLKALIMQLEDHVSAQDGTSGKPLVRTASDTIESLQLLNRLAFDTQGRVLIPFPLLFGGEFRFGEILFDLGEKGSRQEGERRTVRVSVMLDLTQLGSVRADVAMLGSSVTGRIVVGSTESQDQIRKALPEWLDRMKALGYHVLQMNCELTDPDVLSETLLARELVDSSDTLHLVL